MAASIISLIGIYGSESIRFMIAESNCVSKESKKRDTSII